MTIHEQENKKRYYSLKVQYWNNRAHDIAMNCDAYPAEKMPLDTYRKYRHAMVMREWYVNLAIFVQKYKRDAPANIKRKLKDIMETKMVMTPTGSIKYIPNEYFPVYHPGKGVYTLDD